MVQALFRSLPGAEPLCPELTFCVYINFMAMPGQPPHGQGNCFKLHDLRGRSQRDFRALPVILC